MLLNFTALAGNQYRDSQGHTGSIMVNAANGRVTFQGGNLDGFLPAAFYAVYHYRKDGPRSASAIRAATKFSFARRSSQNLMGIV
jgi:hypothetical protein